MWKWRYTSTVLDLGTRCSPVVSFTPRPLYIVEKVGWPPNRSWHFSRREKSFAPSGNGTLVIQPVTVPPELSGLHLQTTQICSDTHPAPYLIGTGRDGHFSVRELTTHLHFAPKLRIYGAIPPHVSRRGSWSQGLHSCNLETFTRSCRVVAGLRRIDS
jgi:hypothetical protein